MVLESSYYQLDRKLYQLLLLVKNSIHTSDLTAVIGLASFLRTKL